MARNWSAGMQAKMIAVVCALLASPVAFAQAPPYTQSTVEKLYAELATLPPAERTKRLEEGARKEGAFVVVHTLRGELGNGHMALFQKRYPFLKIESTTNIGSQDAAERLYAEETSGRHLTDVISVSTTDLAEVFAKNYVARYPTPAVEALTPKFKSFADPDGRYNLFFWSEHAISYNSDLVAPKDAPKDWMDLCNPAFKGGVSFDPAEVRFIAGLNAVLGEAQTLKVFECIGKNDPIIQRGHSQRMELMLAGDHMVQGDNYLYHGLTIKRKNPKAPYVMVISAPIIAGLGGSSINRNAPHPYASALYVDWTVSTESQEYLAHQLRGPVTIKHPYLPDDVTLVNAVDPPKDVAARLMAAWLRDVEKKR
jgi:ABC-type Fe3+ transport system substrate-binding protein